MRSRNLSRYREGPSWGLWAGAVILVLLILGLVGLGFYAARVAQPPPQQAFEQVLPNDKFPK